VVQRGNATEPYSRRGRRAFPRRFSSHRRGWSPSWPSTAAARTLLGWPKRCKLARAFLWEYSDKRLKLAQLLGQTGVFLTCVAVTTTQVAPPAAAASSSFRVRVASRSTDAGGPADVRSPGAITQ
jgi:hypothetical protein